MTEHAPKSCYILQGRVVTMGPAGVLEDGTIYVDGGAIEAVQAASAPAPQSKYRDAPRVRTGGTVFPGFIELHNHLSYNAMPLWEVPRRYSNNDQWRGTEAYARQITKPSQVLGQTDGVAQALVRYAEGRAMLGGTTTSQGITLANSAGVTKYYAGLVRNAEAPDDPRLPRADTNVANPATGRAREYFNILKKNTCYLQHLSEGTDATARGWFHRLRIDPRSWAVNDALCAVHCAALEPEDFRVLAQRGASMVWSPLSNYLLYGQTAPVDAARAAGVPISIGCDWAPSGSKNLLGELKVAWLTSRQQGEVFTPQELVEMATINPARALKWDSLLGSVEAGKLADLVVIDGRGGDPYESLLRARETGVSLVVVGGVPRVGRPSLMRRFWDASLERAGWIDSIAVGGAPRYLYSEHEGDLLHGLPLSDAVRTLRDAMARLPELAREIDAAAGAGRTLGPNGQVPFARGMTVNGGVFRIVPDFEREDAVMQIRSLGFALAAQPYSSWVTDPLNLDPLTVVDDLQYLRVLMRARNLPEFIKRGLPPLYGRKLAFSPSPGLLEEDPGPEVYGDAPP